MTPAHLDALATPDDRRLVPSGVQPTQAIPKDDAVPSIVVG